MAHRYKTITEIPGWLNRLTDDGVPDSNAALYKQVALLFRALRLRCDALSSVPMQILDKQDNEVEWPFPTPLRSLIWKWEASALLNGAAYGEPINNRSRYTKDVHFRNSYDMNVQYAGNGIMEFKQNSSGATWTNDIYNGQYELLYMAEFDPTQDLLPGVSAAQTTNIDTKLLYALSKFPEMYFEGGAMPVTILGVETTDKGEVDRIVQWFKARATKLKNSANVLGVRTKDGKSTISVQTLTPPLKELAFPELYAIAQTNITVGWGIPKTLLFDEAANYAVKHDARLSFYEETIMNRAPIYEDWLTTQLLDRLGLKLHFDFDGMKIFQEDEEKKSKVAINYYQITQDKALAFDLSGKKLTDEQLAKLNAKQEEEQTQPDTTENERNEDPQREEIRRWQRMVEKRVREGKAIREFESDIIPASLHGAISGALEHVKNVDDVKRLFTGVIEWQGYP